MAWDICFSVTSLSALEIGIWVFVFKFPVPTEKEWLIFPMKQAFHTSEKITLE